MNSRYTTVLLLWAAAGFVSCGYQAGGKADLVPKGVQTIAVPAFSTMTLRYRLVDLLPQQIGREFMAHTRFRIVNDPNEADAVLNGSINTVQAGATVLDPGSGKATSIAITVSLTVNLVERSTGRVLFSRPNLSFRQNYEAAVDPHQYLDESGPALDRLSRDVARDVVSAIVENF
ncbi:MAG: hypothetical protein JO091_04565 [Acidobacteriaceae bacterium]|nr:hypothetical protein [Acidobacteriaceae bacterium]